MHYQPFLLESSTTSSGCPKLRPISRQSTQFEIAEALLNLHGTSTGTSSVGNQSEVEMTKNNRSDEEQCDNRFKEWISSEWERFRPCLENGQDGNACLFSEFERVLTCFSTVAPCTPESDSCSNPPPGPRKRPMAAIQNKGKGPRKQNEMVPINLDDFDDSNGLDDPESDQEVDSYVIDFEVEKDGSLKEFSLLNLTTY